MIRGEERGRDQAAPLYAMQIERLVPIAILGLAVVACAVFAVQMLGALARRAHATFAIERANAAQQANAAGLRFGVALACVLASLALVIALSPSAASAPAGASGSGAAVTGQIVYYATIAAPAIATATAPGVGNPPTAALSTVAPAPASGAVSATGTGPSTAPAPSATPSTRATTPAPPSLPTTVAASPGLPTRTPQAATPRPVPTATPGATPAANLPAPDCVDPGSLGILSPAHGETVSGRRTVLVNAGVLQGEVIKFEALNDAGTWAFLARTDVGIRNGPIGALETTQFPPGPRQIRLVLVDRDQREAKFCRITVILKA